MDETRQGLVRRVANALLGLESLSDGKTAKIDPNRVHGGDSGGLALLRDKTPFDFHVSELTSWCAKAEARVDGERRQTRSPMTKLEEDYWFFEEWEGKDYRTVADRTGTKPDEVWRKRERRGVNPQNGKSLDKAA